MILPVISFLFPVSQFFQMRAFTFSVLRSASLPSALYIPGQAAHLLARESVWASLNTAGVALGNTDSPYLSC